MELSFERSQHSSPKIRSLGFGSNLKAQGFLFMSCELQGLFFEDLIFKGICLKALTLRSGVLRKKC